MKYKTTSYVEATQWFKVGDHPEIDIYKPYSVVQCSPTCSDCGHSMLHNHGILWEGFNGYQIVCPGNYIVEDEHGDIICMSEVDFNQKYIPA